MKQFALIAYNLNLLVDGKPLAALLSENFHIVSANLIHYAENKVG